MAVDVVIVNWEGGPELVASVRSALRFGGHPIVVDNASTMGSIEEVARLDGVTVLREPTNAGFAAGCNAGAAAGAGGVILLLNPDAQIVEGTALELESFFASTEATLIGFRLVDAGGRSIPSFHVLPGTATLVADLFRRRWMRPGRRFADVQGRGVAVVGSALAMRRADWHRLGGLDEAFFLWYEDMDLGARVARGGGRVAIASTILVRHTGASTWMRLPRRRRQWLRVNSATRYARKHLGLTATAVMLLVAPAALVTGVLLDIANMLRRRP